jgi:hypothetical protein
MSGPDGDRDLAGRPSTRTATNGHDKSVTYPPNQPYDPYGSGPPVSGSPVSGTPISGHPVSGPMGPMPTQPVPMYPAQMQPMQQIPMSPMPMYAQPVMVVQGPPTSGAAVTSLVLGILGLVTGCCSFGLFSVLAVIFGHVSLNETKNNMKAGRGMGIAGLVMGYVALAPAVVLSIYFVLGSGMAAISGTSTSP